MGTSVCLNCSTSVSARTASQTGMTQSDEDFILCCRNTCHASNTVHVRRTCWLCNADAINNFDGGKRAVFGENATAGIFGTYPQGYMSTGGALGDQIFGTMLLVLCVMAITDAKNMGIPKGLTPIGVGLVIGLVGMTFGSNCGFPINPARDLGPRLLTAIAGYGSDCFTAYNYYFWIPIVGPHIGALCGAWAYLVLVGAHVPDDVEEDPKNELRQRV